MSTFKIIGISGSFRAKSFNHLALVAAQKSMPEGMTMEIVDYSDIPLYNQDIQEKGFPASVEALRAKIAAADGILIASPEYNYSITGVLKNMIDWLSRTSPQPFKEKPAALISATQGPVGGARNQYEVRKILNGLESFVLNKPEVFIGQCHTKFDAAGELTDAMTKKFLGDQMVAFKTWIDRVKN